MLAESGDEMTGELPMELRSTVDLFVLETIGPALAAELLEVLRCNRSRLEQLYVDWVTPISAVMGTPVQTVEGVLEVNASWHAVERGLDLAVTLGRALRPEAPL